MKLNHRLAAFMLGALLSLGLALPVFAQRAAGSVLDGDFPHLTVPDHQFGHDFSIDSDAASAPATIIEPRGGSFGGGGRSFGGGGFGGGGRSFGGGGFGGGGFGGSRSGGSFGGGSRSFGGTSSPRTSPGSSSFGRTGSFGSSGPTRGTNISPGPRGTSSFYYGGRSYYGYGYGGWGGYSYGWLHPAWYYYTPFYPAFYMNPPYMDSYGYYHAGGFSLTHAIGGLCCCPLIFIGIIWMFVKAGGKSVKYTTYR